MYLIDLDGTILNTGYYHNDMAIRFFKIAGIPYDDTKENAYKHLSNYWNASRKTPDGAKIAEDINRTERLFYAEKIGANKGAEDLLRLLYERGEKIIVLTGSPQEHVKLALTRLDLMKYISGSVTMDCIEGPFYKEDPECYRYLSTKFQTPLTDITLIDNDPGYCKAAKQVGINVIGVLNPYYPQFPKEMFEDNYDILFENMWEVYNYMYQQYSAR